MVLVGLRPPLQLQAEVALYREQFPQTAAGGGRGAGSALLTIRLPQRRRWCDWLLMPLWLMGQREILVVMVVIARRWWRRWSQRYGWLDAQTPMRLVAMESNLLDRICCLFRRWWWRRRCCVRQRPAWSWWRWIRQCCQ